MLELATYSFVKELCYYKKPTIGTYPSQGDYVATHTSCASLTHQKPDITDILVAKPSLVRPLSRERSLPRQQPF